MRTSNEMILKMYSTYKFFSGERVVCIYLICCCCYFSLTIFIHISNWLKLASRPHAMYMIFVAIKRRYCPITSYICTDFFIHILLSIIFFLLCVYFVHALGNNHVRVCPHMHWLHSWAQWQFMCLYLPSVKQTVIFE